MPGSRTAVTNLSLHDIPTPLRSAIDGWIDFSLLKGEQVPRFGEEAYAAGSLNDASFELRFDPRRVICGMRGSLLIASIGAPRFRSGGKLQREQVLDGWAEAWRVNQANAAKSVEGSYGVFIADFRTRRALLACDRFARETLCFNLDGARLGFSDRADTIARRCNAELDRQAIYNYLWFHFVPAPQTVFKGVHRLLGGETAHLDGGRLALHKHWVPVFDENSGASYRSMRNEFRELLRKVVEREAAGNVGCFLSGGTDSSTLAGMLTHVTGQRTRTYSIGFAAAGYDETDYARLAAQHFDCRHHEHYVTADDLVAGIPRVAAAYDQPFGNSSALPAYYCALIAKQDGVDTMLGGDGGDELFGGNTRYALQHKLALYGYVPSPLRQLVGSLSQSPLTAKLPLMQKAAGFHQYANGSVPDRLERYNLLRRLGEHEVLTDEWLTPIDRNQPGEQQRRVYDATPSGALINRMLAYDWKYTLADNDLRKVITTCTLAGVRAAFPLIDDELVDFSLRLPPQYKLNGTKLRYFFKKALSDFLPREIINKKKHGFGLPFGRWVTNHPALHELAFGSLEAIRDRGWIQPRFVDDLFQSKLHEHPGYYGEMVWILMMLELWMQAHASAPAAPDLQPQPSALV